MPTVTLAKRRKRGAAAGLFPRTDARVVCHPAQRPRERHISKAAFRRLAMQSPDAVLEHLAD